MQINDSFTIEMGGRRFFAICFLMSTNEEYLVLHCHSPLSVQGPFTSIQYLCLQQDETSGLYKETITGIEVQILLDVVHNVWYN
jgi:hypothetical protein